MIAAAALADQGLDQVARLLRVVAAGALRPSPPIPDSAGRLRAEVLDALSRMSAHMSVFTSPGWMTLAVTPLPASLGGQMARELVQRRLARAVGAVDRTRLVQRRSGGDVDDAAPAGADHAVDEGAAGEVGRDGVDHHRLDPVVRVGLPDQLDRPEDAGRIDQDRGCPSWSSTAAFSDGDRRRVAPRRRGSRSPSPPSPCDLTRRFRQAGRRCARPERTRTPRPASRIAAQPAYSAAGPGDDGDVYLQVVHARFLSLRRPPGIMPRKVDLLSRAAKGKSAGQLAEAQARRQPVAAACQQGAIAKICNENKNGPPVGGVADPRPRPFGSPYGSRTRLSRMRIWRPNR